MKFQIVRQIEVRERWLPTSWAQNILNLDEAERDAVRTSYFPQYPTISHSEISKILSKTAILCMGQHREVTSPLSPLLRIYSLVLTIGSQYQFPITIKVRTYYYFISVVKYILLRYLCVYSVLLK